MIPVLCIFLFIIIYCINKFRIHNPLTIIFLPLLLSWLLYDFKLSNYYNYDYLPLTIIFVSYGFFIIGFYVRYPVSKKHEFNLILNSIPEKKLSIAIKVFLVLGSATFIIESIVVYPPLLSGTPTKNYMAFGLPLIHHFISLLKINAFLTVIHYMKTKKKSLLFFSLFISSIIYTLIMARMMLFNYILILLLSYIILNIKIDFKTLFKVFLGFCLFLFVFIFLGELRLQTAGEDYLRKLSGIEADWVPVRMTLPYIYLTVSNQNLINLISSFNHFDYGLDLISNFFPLIDINYIKDYNINDFQVSNGLTTFSFGFNLYKSFGVFYILINFMFGWLVAYLYQKTKKSLTYIIFYFSYAMPVLFFSFFSDTFLSSSFVIFLLTTITLNNYFRI